MKWHVHGKGKRKLIVHDNSAQEREKSNFCVKRVHGMCTAKGIVHGMCMAKGKGNL